MIQALFIDADLFIFEISLYPPINFLFSINVSVQRKKAQLRVFDSHSLPMASVESIPSLLMGNIIESQLLLHLLLCHCDILLWFIGAIEWIT